MAKDNNNETFDDKSFENEFDFIDAEEFEDIEPTTSATTAAPASSAASAGSDTSASSNVIANLQKLFANSPPKAKWFAMLISLAIVSILVMTLLPKRAEPDMEMTEAPIPIPGATTPAAPQTTEELAKTDITTKQAAAPTPATAQAAAPATTQAATPATTQATAPAKDDLSLADLIDQPTDKTATSDNIEKLFSDIVTKQSPTAPAKVEQTITAADYSAAPAANEVSANAEVQRSLANLTNDLATNTKNIQQLKTTLTDITTSLENLQRTLSNMDTKVLGLTETVSALSNDIINVKKVISEEDLDLASTKLSAKRPAITYTAPEYTVHAIIPGRAWLKSSSGNIITVAEGDSVGDYGTVAVIDAANNLVRTSSGVAFR